MKHILQTNLDLVTSKQIADRALGHYQQRLAKYQPTVHWLDYQHAEVHFRAKGINVTGKIEIRPGEVEIDLDVPFVFRIFRGAAIRILDEELRKLIAEHEAGVDRKAAAA
jgi:hypothetical protein